MIFYVFIFGEFILCDGGMALKKPWIKSASFDEARG